MRCQDCPRFEVDSENCKDRKLNPQTWQDAVQSAQIFGPRALCQMNDYRERILSVWFEGKEEDIKHGSNQDKRSK